MVKNIGCFQKPFVHQICLNFERFSIQDLSMLITQLGLGSRSFQLKEPYLSI